MPSDEERIQALETRVRQLETRLEAVTAELEARRATRDSMRAALRCPACGARRILRAHKITDRDGGPERPMAVSTKGLFFPEPRGVFECDVCAACGLVEWHIPQPDQIDTEHDDIELIEVDESEPAGPYR